jgi:hypothetical protein
VYHKAIGKMPYEGWTGITPELDSLQIFGALVTARKPGKRPVKDERHTAHGALLGFGSSTKHVRYFNLTTIREKLSSHHVIDKPHYGTARHPAGAWVLMDMGYNIPSLPLVPLQPPKPSVYPTRSRHKCITPLPCILILPPLHKFTPTPVAVAASLAVTSRPLHASDVHRNDGIAMTLSTDPFGPSFPETIYVSGIHPTLGIDIRHDMDRQRCQLVAMTPGKPSHLLPQWKLHLCHAFLLSVDTTAVYTILDVHQEIALVLQAAHTYVIIVFAKDDANNSLYGVGLPHLYFDQQRVMKAHIAHTVQAVVHKSITGPAFINSQTVMNGVTPNGSSWITMTNMTRLAHRAQ